MYNVRKPNSTDFDLTKCMLDETQVYEAQVEKCGAIIGIYHTRKDAKTAADSYSKRFHEPTYVALSWIKDKPESVAQRDENNEG